MSELHGPEIVRFYIDGAVADPGDLVKKQFFEEGRLKARMLRAGYVPVLDIAPLVNHEYLADKETFRYAITMYGVKVEEPWNTEGWLNGREIQATLATKSERLSSQSV